MGIQEAINNVKEKIFYEKKRLLLKKQNVMLGNYAKVGSNCSVGAYSYIGSYSSADFCTIGRYSSIGDFCTIGPGEHRIKLLSTSYTIYKNQFGIEYYEGDDSLRKSVVIGNDVWIGCNSVIRRGVTIGNGAVVGACSFVNRDVPDYAVVAGIPAKIIKYRFDKDEIEKLLSSKWWEKDVAEARKILERIASNSK